MRVQVWGVSSLLLLTLGAPRNAVASGSAQATEVVLGFMVDETGVTYRVASNGCTGKRDFAVRVLPTTPRHLDLVRLHGDPCDGQIPHGVELTFSWSELGLEAGDRWEPGNRIAATILAGGNGEGEDGADAIVDARPIAAPSVENVLGFTVDEDGITCRVVGRVSTSDSRIRTLSTHPRYVLLVRGDGSEWDEVLQPWTTDLFFAWKEIGVRPRVWLEIGNPVVREGVIRMYY